MQNYTKLTKTGYIKNLNKTIKDAINVVIFEFNFTWFLKINYEYNSEIVRDYYIADFYLIANAQEI